MKPVPQTPVRPEPAEADIQKCAYFLWKEAGSPPGREADFWLAAKELLRHRAHEMNRRPARNPHLSR